MKTNPSKSTRTVRGKKARSPSDRLVETSNASWRDLKSDELAQLAREFLELAELGRTRDSPQVSQVLGESLEYFNQRAKATVFNRRAGGRQQLKWTLAECLRLYAMVRRGELSNRPLNDVLQFIGDNYAVPIGRANSMPETFKRAKQRLSDVGMLALAEVLVREQLIRVTGISREAVLLNLNPSDDLKRCWAEASLLPDPLLPTDYPLIADRSEITPWIADVAVTNFLVKGFKTKFG